MQALGIGHCTRPERTAWPGPPLAIFNIHVNGSDAGNPKSPGRVYIDPLGEQVAGGLIKAAKITYGKANAMYG